MITAADIRPFHHLAIDDEETRKLKAKLANLHRERNPFFLNKLEFEEILPWKLGQQIGRQRKARLANNDEVIRSVTSLAFTITHPDTEYQLELRMVILCVLRGVGVPVASAVLSLIFPEDYAVIDYRVWRQLFNEDKTAFSIPDYKRYIQKIQSLAAELGWPSQEVDHAIWEYDRRSLKIL